MSSGQPTGNRTGPTHGQTGNQHPVHGDFTKVRRLKLTTIRRTPLTLPKFLKGGSMTTNRRDPAAFPARSSRTHCSAFSAWIFTPVSARQVIGFSSITTGV